jgi:hypothetical protein
VLLCWAFRGGLKFAEIARECTCSDGVRKCRYIGELLAEPQVESKLVGADTGGGWKGHERVYYAMKSAHLGLVVQRGGADISEKESGKYQRVTGGVVWERERERWCGRGRGRGGVGEGEGVVGWEWERKRWCGRGDVKAQGGVGWVMAWV